MEYKPELILALHSLRLDHLVIQEDPPQILAAFHWPTNSDEYLWDPSSGMSRAEIVMASLDSSPDDPWKGLTVKPESNAS